MMQCHWRPHINDAKCQCPKEAEIKIEDSDLWYCLAHFDQVMANREWLRSYAAQVARGASNGEGADGNRQK